MTELSPNERGWATDDILACLSDRGRRVVLSILQERTKPVSLSELATNTAAVLADEPLVEVSPEMRDNCAVTLHHEHLPKLADAGLVEWTPEDGTVAATDHTALQDERVQQMLNVDADDLDQVLRAIRPARRRLALSVVETAGSIGPNELARRVKIHESERSTGPSSDTETVLATLHHTHLPALQQAGLVVCEDGTISYAGHPALDPSWLELGPTVTPAEPADTVGTGEKLWTIDGCEDIVARGQSLFEQADDELFIMITTDGLLEPGCISRLEDALDRGVDVYLGSQSPTVRDLVRERLPEVVIWEPQRDWLNLPPEREKVGRLVLADRRAVLLGTLGEKLDDGYEEMALTGEGDGNTLVVLLRELLGDRVDHLDAQSEDFLEQIPL